MATLPNSFDIWTYDNPKEVVPITTAAGDLATGLTVPGICAGASARWCYKMLTERDPRESKPEKSVARELQGLYQGLVKNKSAANLDIRPFFKAARLTAVEGANPGALDRGDFAATSLKVRDNVGVYWYGPPGHAIGVAKRSDSEYYYFEPEKGLYRLNDRVKFKNQVGNNFLSKLNSPHWWLVRVTLA